MGTRLFMMTAIAVAMSAVATDLSWTGVHTLELGPTATMTFADSSAKAWSGTLLIKGFRDKAVKFGSAASALAGAQVAMLRAETPDGKKTRLHITSAGYLVTPGTVVSVR